MKSALYILILSTFIIGHTDAQSFKTYGRVLTTTGEPLSDATVFVESINVQASTDDDGYFAMKLPKGVHVLEVFSMGSNAGAQSVTINQTTEVNFVLSEFSENLEEVEIISQRKQTSGIARLQSVDGFGIYEAKKNELIIMDDFAANKVTNNARQVFGKVPGLNIWESDFAGLQLDIAARGLGPSRTANFNTRQNGYDMSADALGYPESYYMPAMQAVDRIEIVRGAASLQYGTQFGGMLNFRLKEAPDEPFQLNLEQAAGSFGLLNSFVSAGGTLGKVDYYSYYQYRTGDGWRDNSGFDSHLAFARVGLQATDRLKVGFEYSFLDYIAQQPGGLTDEDFENGDLTKSRRSRNWFQVKWNLIANTIDYKFSDRTKLNVRTFGLFSSRDALGNLNQINVDDNPTENRTLITDSFQNFGTELRVLHHYNFLGQKSALVVGGRYYNGMTNRKQGDASASSDADFNLLNPESPEEFDYDFPSTNVSLFAESIFNLSDKLSITAGGRLEYIETIAEGVWNRRVEDRAGNVISVQENFEDRTDTRYFPLLGLGASYYLSQNLNLYSNFSQNFRSITFSDLRVNNPNFQLDSLITDERGFNVDLGVRGKLLSWLTMDASVFWLEYSSRIGEYLLPGLTTSLRTNTGDSRHFGIESYTEFNILKLLDRESENTSLSLFTNIALTRANYIRSDEPGIQGSRVEYVPEILARIGTNYSWNDFKATFQFSYLGDQFTDGTNEVREQSAIIGLVPSYHVMDLSFEYNPDPYKVTFGVNNVTDEAYFTRRAVSYPGPGIIPATPRSFYVSLGIKI